MSNSNNDGAMSAEELLFVIEHAKHAAHDIAAKSILHGNDLWKRFRDAGLYKSFDHPRFSSTAMSICGANDPAKAKQAAQALTEHLSAEDLSRLLYESSILSPLLRQIVVINARSHSWGVAPKIQSIDALLSTFVDRGADLGKDIGYSSGSDFVKSNVLGQIAYMACSRGEAGQEALIEFARVYARNGVSWTSLEVDPDESSLMHPRKNAVAQILSHRDVSAAAKWIAPIFEEGGVSAAELEKASHANGVQSETLALFQAQMAKNVIGNLTSSRP